MSRHTENIFREAVHQFQQGNLDSAEKLAMEILAGQPRRSDALHLLGVVTAMRGEASDAAALFTKALARDARNPELHANLAKALCELGRFEEAVPSYQKAIRFGGGGAAMSATIMEQGTALRCLGRDAEALTCYDKAIELTPAFAEAWTNKGTLLDELRRHEEAVACHDKATGINPEFAMAWFNKGAGNRSMRKFEEALSCFDRAVSLAPENPLFWLNRGEILDHLNRYHDALASYERALSLKPDYLEAWNNRGLTLYEINLYDEALGCFDKALTINAHFPKAWNNRGLTLTRLHRTVDAVASYDRALAIQPDYAQAWSNRGVLLQDLGRYREALDSYEKAMAVAPGDIGSNFNVDQRRMEVGLCRLAMGDFERGWQEYEWRLKLQVAKPLPGIPLWDGKKNTPSLLIRGEQGIGDQILYASMLDEVQHYADSVIVTLDARLIPLFQRSFGGISFLPLDESLDGYPIEAQIPIGSLGRYLRTTIGDFSRQQAGYLAADKARAAVLRSAIKKDSSLVCGISWTSANEKIGSSKSMALEDLLPNLASDLLSFVDLQYGDTSLERQRIKSSSGIAVEHLDEIDNFTDIDGLASLIEACDVVVTVSNVTAHLAGALGKKTFLLVPYAHGKLWYWHLVNQNSLWYPTVSVFSQAAEGDWKSAVEDVRCEIDRLLLSR